ncbi:MAG: 4-hydroxy-tetrahydrodipicolinate synthase [Candidatus Vecturithrix sp.]|jgi:4-hydroxy-tetrahydrodipicolinate synthase|nr:4-hydroxy-tetrahydrodipicolinate synthase [Candidatus Vecturithrix sp.]
MQAWGRLITAMVTPFTANLEVDYEKAVSLAKHLEQHGTTALVICGTTGESPTLSPEEQLGLFKIIKKHVKIPVIAGVGTNSTAKTIHNAKAALECDVDGLLVIVPYYNKPDQESMYAHFRAVAEAVDAKIMMYNVPGRTGVNMLPVTVAKLAEIENIVALKEASGNIVQLSEMVAKTPKHFSIYTGDDALTLPCLAVGGYGVVSVASQVVGDDMSAMIQSYLQGSVDQAAHMHLELLDIYNTLFLTSNPIPVKAALNMLGVAVGGLRLPLTEANSAIQAEIRRSLQQLNLIN